MSLLPPRKICVSGTWEHIKSVYGYLATKRLRTPALKPAQNLNNPIYCIYLLFELTRFTNSEKLLCDLDSRKILRFIPLYVKYKLASIQVPMSYHCILHM